MSTKTPAYYYQLAHINEDKGPQTVAVSGFLIAITTLAVVLRLLAQRIVKPSFTADDYCAFFALARIYSTGRIIAVALCGDLIASVHYGLGKHVLAVENGDRSPPQDIVNVFKTGYSISVLWIPDLFLVRLSLLLFYRRIFTTRVRRVRIATWTVGAYVTAWAIASLIVFILQCSPIHYFWDRTYLLVGLEPPSRGTCLPSYTHQAAPMILSAVSDFLILLLPGIALWPLQIRWAKKIGLFLLFSLGVFVCGASIVKIYFVFAVNNSSDSTWFNTEILLWTIVECCIGLVCACIPCMTPLTRLVTMGPVAAFSTKKASTMNAINLRPWPGGRRLPSLEDSRVILSGSNNELNDWPDQRCIQIDISGSSPPERQWHSTTLASSRAVEAYGSTQTNSTIEVPQNAIHVEQRLDQSQG